MCHELVVEIQGCSAQEREIYSANVGRSTDNDWIRGGKIGYWSNLTLYNGHTVDGRDIEGQTTNFNFKFARLQ